MLMGTGGGTLPNEPDKEKRQRYRATTAKLGKITSVLHEKLLGVYGSDPTNPQNKPRTSGKQIWVHPAAENVSSPLTPGVSLLRLV
eukprot:COSAG04_NODE_932_length_9350_cov_665.689007_5_plen_86_part_00